eukprot:361711-Chlamydomonas_euryale.AAC.3
MVHAGQVWNGHVWKGRRSGAANATAASQNFLLMTWNGCQQHQGPSLILSQRSGASDAGRMTLAYGLEPAEVRMDERG